MAIEAEQYRWRETYFVWFSSRERPTLRQVEEAIQSLDSHYELVNPEADFRGLLESITVRSPDDNAILEIDYATGDDLLIEAATLAEEVTACEAIEPDKLALLTRCDARFEVMHFEQTYVGETDEDSEEMFDPATLLRVLDVLIHLTRGIGVDPQSGMLL